MTMQPIQSLYSQLRSSPTASHVDLCVFASLDGQQFCSYPPSTFGLSPSTFESVLPDLGTKLAVQASSPRIHAAIREAEWPQHEVQLDYSCSLPVVNTAAELKWFTTDHIRSAAFMRFDGSLVLWGDSESQILYIFEEILSCIQNRYDTSAPNSVPFPALSGPGEIDLNWSLFDNLPPLDEFSSLTTVPGPTAPSLTSVPQTYAQASLYPTGFSESPGLGGLQLSLHPSGTSSPSSDASAFSFGDPPSWTHFVNNSLNPAFLLNLSGVEEATSEVSSFSAASSDGGASPVLSASSGCTTSQEPPLPTPATATGPSSFRRHSIGEASAPLGYSTSRKAKRASSEDGDNVPKINISGESHDDNVVVNQHLVLDVRPPKRLRPIPTPTSAPALLIPLPTFEHASQATTTDDNASVNKDNKLDRTSSPAPAPPTTPLHPATPATQPAAPSSARSGSGSTHRRARRRTAPARTKRTPCDYCTKTFSRVQDAQRHIATSCTANPEKMGVQCPECGSVLSRLDAAQRHWRGHENPSCEAPEWALRA